MTPKKQNEWIARQGIKILLNDCAFTQIEIIQKCQQLDIKISKSSLSNLVSAKRKVGTQAMRNLAKGIAEILKRETCLGFESFEEGFVEISNCTPRPIVPQCQETMSPIENLKPKYLIHDGRIDVPDKVQMYQKATYEIIELGLRLKNFTQYFSSKRDSAFLDPIRQKLSEGIHFKCYVLNPAGNFARRYFEDRAIVHPFEKMTFETSPKIITDLQQFCRQLNREGFDGKMSLFQYDHFPYFHASVIDGDTENGMMYFSSYLYGQVRVNTPVIEVYQKADKKLFKRYWKSIQAIISSPTISQLV